MVKYLHTLMLSCFLVRPTTTRARDPKEIRDVCRRLNISVSVSTSVGKGLARAIQEAGSDTPVVVTGSHFVVGEAIAWLGGKNYLTINQ